MKKFQSYLLVATSFVALNAFAADQDASKQAVEAQATAVAASQTEFVAVSQGSVTVADKNAAAYFTLENKTANDLTLTAVSSDVADKTELHQTITDDKGVASMKPVESVAIKAGESFEFKAGADHVMLMGLKNALNAGDKVKLTLHFSDNSTQDIELEVK